MGEHDRRRGRSAVEAQLARATQDVAEDGRERLGDVPWLATHPHLAESDGPLR